MAIICFLFKVVHHQIMGRTSVQSFEIAAQTVLINIFSPDGQMSHVRRDIDSINIKSAHTQQVSIMLLLT